jgi:hypothetical protein
VRQPSRKIVKSFVPLYSKPSTTPQETPFFMATSSGQLWTTLDRVRSQNEARVVRDITPYVVPSAEHLHTRGASGHNYLTEETEGEWSKCIPLGGPQPNPDFAVGLAPSAFTDSEIEKLKFYTVPQKPTLFTGNFYFPLLLCEVKVRPTMYTPILCPLISSAARTD